MHHHYITFTGIGEQGRKLRAYRVLAGCMVGEQLVQAYALKLAIRVLVVGTDADIADALSSKKSVGIRS